jgi:hypothetical protein
LHLARGLRCGSQEYGKIVAQKRIQIVKNTCRIAALVVTNLLASPFWRYLFEVVLKTCVVVLMFVMVFEFKFQKRGRNKECKLKAAEGVASGGTPKVETKASVFIETAGRTAVV